ncbi:MAG: Z1 domain-containing protein, partial [Ureaplasma sp.]|nr:Z1 domain-containing protein [Ureaplasma sp.]
VSFEEFENIFQKLKNEINESLIVLNSNKNNDDECYVESDLKIYIGGFLLSRGLTFENLLVEYFGYTPDSITYDTLLQRCRWFGYRSKLINHMKIICKEKTITYLKECEDCIEYFFNNNTLNGAKFKLAELRNKISSIKKTTSNYKKG